MRPQLRPNPTPRVQVRTVAVFATGAVLLVALLALLLYERDPGDESAATQAFFFTPGADNLYENPANWLPAYPGTRIAAGSTVTLQGVAYVPHYDLEVAGTLVIMMDATLYASSQTLRVLPGGAIVNDGELVAQRLENAGKVTNNLAASLSLDAYIAGPGAETENLRGASFAAARLLTNEGTFYNYGRCQVKDTFDNRGTFHKSPGSELVVRETTPDNPLP